MKPKRTTLHGTSINPAKHHGPITLIYIQNLSLYRLGKMAAKSSKILMHFGRFCMIRSVLFSSKRDFSSYGKAEVFWAAFVRVILLFSELCGFEM